MEMLLTLGSVIVTYGPNLIGCILPPFVEILNKDIKNDNERYIVAIITCLLVAILLHWKAIASGAPQDTLLYAGIIFTESNTVYKLYFANSKLRGVMQDKMNIPQPKGSGIGEAAVQPEKEAQ